jgi:endonuclease YncB( thermonuclease family)
MRFSVETAVSSPNAALTTLKAGTSARALSLPAYGLYLDETLPGEPRASQRYATAEAEARKQRQGLWKEWLGEK